MTRDPDWRSRLVERLRELARQAIPPAGGPPANAKARATLAILRRGAGKEFDADTFGWVLKGGIPRSEKDENDGMLVATLFALHPDHLDGVSLGDAMRTLQEQSVGDSPERRFTTLLDTRRADLPARLRHTVKLLRSKGIPLDWLQFLDDLSRWNSVHRSVQRRWSRDFWAPPATEIRTGQETRSAASQET